MATVTICLPIWNTAQYLQEAIDGILAQTFTDWRLIISDNASNDNTREIIAKYRDSRIEYFRHETNIGAVPNWQSVMSRVTTPFFCFHAGDDYFLPQHLERRLGALEAYPEAPYAHGLVKLIDQDGRFIGEDGQPLSSFESNVSIVPRFLYRNIVNVAGAVLRTAAVRKLGFTLDSRYSLLVDWHLFMTLALYSTGTLYDDVPTAAYRRHQGSISIQKSPQSIWILESLRVRLDSLRENRPAWSKIVDPEAEAREITRRLWRPTIGWLLRGEPATSWELGRLFLTRGA